MAIPIIEPTTIQKFVVSSKNGIVEIHAHDAGQHDRRQQHSGQQGQRLHDVVRVLRDPAHVDVVRAEQAVAHGIDRRDRTFQAVDEPGPRLADGLFRLHLRAGEGGQRFAMRRERSARETDAPSERHEGTQDVVLGPAVQGALVEVVDVALDHLDELEIPDEDLVHQRRQQVGGIERAQAGFAIQAIDVPFEGADRAGVHGEHEVPPRDQVDLATGQPIGVVFRGLESLEGEVQPILGPPGVGTPELVPESLLFRLGELQASRQSRASASSSSARSMSIHRSCRSPSFETSRSARSIRRSCPSASNSRAVTGLS